MKQTFFIVISLFFAAAATATVSDTEIENSFNCNKADTTLEHLICAEQKLTVLVKQMKKAYNNKKKTLSSTYKKSMVTTQKKWLRNRSKKCKLPKQQINQNLFYSA